MANDTSKLTINNKTYDLKDANARCSKYQYTLNKNNWSNNTYALSVSASNIDCKCYNTIELSNYYDINQWKTYGISIESTEKNYDGSTDTTTLATIYFKCETVPESNLTFTIVTFPSKTSVDGDLVNPYNDNDYTNADKALVQDSPITVTSTGAEITASTAQGSLNTLTVYGKSEVVDGAIKSAGDSGSIEIKTCGKNLFNPTQLDVSTSNWQYLTITLKPNTTYTMSTPDLPDSTLQDEYPELYFMLETQSAGIDHKVYINHSITKTSDANGEFKIQYRSRDITDEPLTNYNFMLAEGSTATAYEPYTGTTAIFSTGTPLRGIPDTDVRDVMTWNGSAGTVTKVCAKVRLVDLTWLSTLDSSGKTFFVTINPSLSDKAAGSTAMICAKYRTVGPDRDALRQNNKAIAPYNTSSPLVAVRDDDCNTLSDFVASLGDAELVYELATPTTEQLTTAENASIAELRTFEPQTHAQNNAQTEMTVEAYAGTENGKAVTEIADKIDVLSSDKETKSVELSYADYVALPTKDPETSYYVPDAPDTWIFGYDLDKDDENPFTRVSYPADVDNTFYTPAFMDYTNDVFNYGSWNFKPGEKFMPNPCMLLYNGTVDYYLDPDDNTKKADGTASDIADTSYGGNAMMEWGLLYTKRWEENGVYKFRCSNVRLDADWECWCNYDINNKVIPHFYTPIYFGSYDGTRMRSLSGQSNMVSTTRQQEIDRAKANGDGWFTEVYSDSLLFQDLCIMMSKCTDVQTAFGTGRVKSSNTSAIAPGTMNTKGMFWGSTDQTSGVKIFGMENPYGNIWRGKAGYLYINGVPTIKMTQGIHDGSTATDYNITGDGYLTLSDATISSSGWQKDMITTPYGRFPKTIGGASNKYECDYVYVNNHGTFYLLFGGSWGTGLYAGFYVAVDAGAAHASSAVGASLSCKPLA